MMKTNPAVPVRRIAERAEEEYAEMMSAKEWNRAVPVPRTVAHAAQRNFAETMHAITMKPARHADRIAEPVKEKSSVAT